MLGFFYGRVEWTRSVEVHLAMKPTHTGKSITQRCDSLQTDSFESGMSHDHLVNADKTRGTDVMISCTKFSLRHYFTKFLSNFWCTSSKNFDSKLSCINFFSLSSCCLFLLMNFWNSLSVDQVIFNFIKFRWTTKVRIDMCLEVWPLTIAIGSAMFSQPKRDFQKREWFPWRK